MKDRPEASQAGGTLYVCSTSHMDWDWLVTHKTYYEQGDGSTLPVRRIIDQAYSILTTPSDSPYQYNLCELAWLRDYLKEFPEKLAVFQGFTRRQFQLMGGGITSPDNLVCNGELFIRNYLLGRIYASKNGLSHLVSNVCWIPDDFGHDPQLPVVVEAMAMKGSAFWRVPGNQPSEPGPINPLAGGDSIATQLKANGVTFLWQANDHSTMIAQNLWDGYGVIWDQSDAGAADLQSFVEAYLNGSVIWPNPILFAPCGGDFSPASTTLLDSISTYNSDFGDNAGIVAVLGSFEDYLDHLKTSGADLGPPVALDPSNFWTGYFSSQVALKKLQQNTVTHLLAAEALATLLLSAGADQASLESLNEGIAEAWELAAPSSHHDYITGTSVNTVYEAEQLPLLEAARAEAGKVLETAMHLLGGAVEAADAQGDLPCVVFNPLGSERSLGRITALSVPDAGRFQSVRIDGHHFPVQPTGGQELRFEAPADMPSLGYRVVSLSTAPSQDGDAVGGFFDGQKWILENSRVRIVVDPQNGYAISSLIDKANGETELVQTNEFANRLAIYNENYPKNGECQTYGTSNEGNIYQMGNEFYPECTDGSGFYLSENLVAGGSAASFADQGPLAWTLRCPLEDSSGNAYCLEYVLHKDEPLVRIQLAGAALAGAPNSIVTSWAVQNGPDKQPARHAYGTANHWADDTIQQYWNGPTFRATHDFALLQTADKQPIGAIYHDGIPSWAFDDGALKGILLRNPSGGGRGASATDTDQHVQRFAYRLPGVGEPESCAPLQESMAYQLAPRAVMVQTSTPTLPERGHLAQAQQGYAVVRAARTQETDGETPNSFILRIYQPTRVRSDFRIDLPFLANRSATAETVTALEEPTEGPNPILEDTTLQIADMPTLATVRIVLLD
jgi:alpha-mannosidase